MQQSSLVAPTGSLSGINRTIHFGVGIGPSRNGECSIARHCPIFGVTHRGARIPPMEHSFVVLRCYSVTEAVDAGCEPVARRMQDAWRNRRPRPVHCGHFDSDNAWWAPRRRAQGPGKQNQILRLRSSSTNASSQFRNPPSWRCGLRQTFVHVLPCREVQFGCLPTTGLDF